MSPLETIGKVLTNLVFLYDVKLGFFVDNYREENFWPLPESDRKDYQHTYLAKTTWRRIQYDKEQAPIHNLGQARVTRTEPANNPGGKR